MEKSKGFLRAATAARATFTYTTTCYICGVVVDSRKQFVECACNGLATLWSTCDTCFVPIRSGKSCEGCCALYTGV
eukprot:2135167-Prymnesium_polylepis.1